MNPLKWLVSFLPRDNKKRVGMFGLTLGQEYAWMFPILKTYHDSYYDEGPKMNPPMQASEVSARIFLGLTICANQEKDWIKRCRKYTQICYVWRTIRVADHLLYNRANYGKE